MAKQYKNAPIEEALCEVRFDPDGWDISVPGRVYERLRNTYDAPVVPQHRMRIAASGPNVTVDAERDAAMLISNAAGSQRVRLGEAAISVHVVRPYPGWTRLQPALSEALKAYRDVAQPKRASRIGVRYINRIQIPVDRPFEVSDYLRVGRVTPEEFPVQTSSIFHRVEHLYDDGIKLIFAFATLATEKGSALLLDLDVIREAEIAADDVLSVVDALHEREGEAFEALVTDEARRIFNDG